MELEFFGANCFRIKTKEIALVVDDNLSAIGGKSIQTEKTVAFYTNPLLLKGVTPKSHLVISSPGEFEVGDVTVKGAQARGHMDKEDEQNAAVFQFMANGQTITVLGHVHPDLSSEVKELIGGTDVLVVPVGGNGFTLDPAGAASAVKEVEPGYVVPAQYDIAGLNYEVPAVPLAEFMKLFPSATSEPENSLKLAKGVEDTTGQTKVVVLKPQVK